MHYGKEQAEVILNIVGNVISGQVSGDTSKQLSERFGKIMQDRQSVSLNSRDTSISHSKQLELAIPQSKIASLSSGEFVGMVSDNPDQKIELKTFCGEILSDHETIKREQAAYKDLQQVSSVSPKEILENYLTIKRDVQTIVETEIERMLDTPELTDLLIRKN